LHLQKKFRHKMQWYGSRSFVSHCNQLVKNLLLYSARGVIGGCCTNNPPNRLVWAALKIWLFLSGLPCILISCSMIGTQLHTSLQFQREHNVLYDISREQFAQTGQEPKTNKVCVLQAALTRYPHSKAICARVSRQRGDVAAAAATMNSSLGRFN
jgi:hypothetical protein